MKILKLVASAALATAILPAAAYAQAAAPTLTAGATVYDPQGGEVGTIASTAGGNVVIDTGTHKATIPGAAVTKGAKGLQIAYTRAQLDAAIEAAANQAKVQLEAALVPGAQVFGKSGTPVGTVKEMNEANQVVVERADGTLIALPKNAFAKTANGLQISLTEQQLSSQANQAQAQLEAALVPGTQVFGKSGAPVGAVKEINEANQVVVERADGTLIALPKSTFAKTANGLQISLTEEQLASGGNAANGAAQ